ncbi:hypothetical protein [Coralloluteibacterium thermophilus]|uniref:Uncharacterized protein n=1 Tax=Coralloluteibacterium thermophilum TaxID=2707049 RepID=A0ABV9NQG8_9GAMM
MNDEKKRPPSAGPTEDAPAEYDHSSGDRNTQQTPKTRKENFHGGTQRRTNLDVPKPRE